MTYTPEQLRELADICERHTFPVLTAEREVELLRAYADALEELARVKKAISESCDEQRGEYFGCRRAERAEAALAECRAKLEVDPRTKYDGIDSRDETIRLLENELEESARLHGMGASREAALQARLAESERKCERGCFCLMEMMQAYERRVRSLCAPEEIEKRPWECAEYNKAAEYLRAVWKPDAYRAEFKEKS